MRFAAGLGVLTLALTNGFGAEKFVPLPPPGQGGALSKGQECSNPPTALKDLNAYSEEGHEISSTAAGRFGFPALSVSGSGENKHFVFDYAQYKECPSVDGGGVLRIGVTVRLLVTVSNITATSKLSLPLIAASAELGHAQASYRLEVQGASSQTIGKLIPALASYNVENHVKLMDAVRAIKDAIYASDATISVVTISRTTREDITDGALRGDIGSVWAVQGIADGESCVAARQRATQVGIVVDAIEATYIAVVDECSAVKPSAAAQARAREILGKVRMK